MLQLQLSLGHKVKPWPNKSINQSLKKVYERRRRHLYLDYKGIITVREQH